ncbi:MAG: metallophosphoesterase [Gemmataceae bacterium]|nr:metallophosphoesterase [Gemmataceae bacterium]
MIRHMWNWLRQQPVPTTRPHNWARWVGRNWAHWTYATRIEPHWLELNRYTVPIRGLPPAFRNLHLVQMSDFHAGHHVPSAFLHEAVDLTHAQKPDVIVLTGDFIHKGYQHVERVAKDLSRLHAPMGVFAVLGNHDFSVRNALGMRRYRDLHQAVADSLTQHGIRLLRNETHPLERDGQKLYLTGIDDLWSRMMDLDRSFDGLCPNTPRVVLAHNPLTIEMLNGRRCDLMLSGHTHGGQVKLPGIGRLALGPKGRRFAAGMYRVGDSVLYVNKGVGCGLRIRYGVRPEVAVLTLAPSAPDMQAESEAVKPPVQA